VATFGQADRQLQVLVDPARLAARHVTLSQIVATAGNSQLVSPLSYLQASTPGTGGFLEGPNQRITIRHVLPFGTPGNLARVPVAGIKGRPVELGRVAQVVAGHQPLIGDGLVRGRPGLVLVIQKLPSANVLSVTRGLDQALASLRPSVAGVRVESSIFRPASYLDSALGNLRVLVIIAAALAALALILLLAGFRLAFISLAAIVLSVITVTVLLYALGYTFNALVALGLLVALAVVVDDAAGAADRVLARRWRPAEPAGGPAASLLLADALTEFRGPLCTAAVAILAAAAPLLLASGLTAEFVRPMALAFVLSVAVSMVVALVVTPALTVVLMAPRWRGPRIPGLLARFGGFYRDLLGRGLRIPRLALLVLLIIGLGGLALLPAMHPRRPTFQDRDLVIRWTGPPGMSLTEMDRLTGLASHELQGLSGVQDVAATIGRAVSSDQLVSPNSAEIWVTIRPDADYDSAVAQVREIATGTPGVQGSVATYETDSMAGVLAGHPGAVTVRLYGPEYPELTRLAGQVKTIMSHVSGLRRPRAALPVEQPTLDVRVNLDQATRDGVKAGDIRREAATLVNGLTVGNFFEQQAVFDVVVAGTPAVRSSLSSVGGMLLDTVNGGHARLGSLARVSISPEPEAIPHEAMSRFVDVTANVSGGNASAAAAALSRQLRQVRFPLQYYFSVRDGSGGASTSGTELALYAVAALLAIVLLAQAVFGSWRLALLLLAALPLPVAAGAVTALAMGDQDSLAAAVALLGVLAIAMRQAFRMIAAIRQRHCADGGELTAELVGLGAVDGARPVLASMVVTAVMLLPFVALGDAAGNELLHVAAAVILAGLVAATLVNVYVLPIAVQSLGPASAPAETEEDLETAPEWTSEPTSQVS
jgi:multidrug efflux pump subunit AcrB